MFYRSFWAGIALLVAIAIAARFGEINRSAASATPSEFPRSHIEGP